ncbi:MAG TPA: hypothetical protein VFS29_04240 [Motilibacteraceae bacterium]|jgi:hypothetical protein|nr:hypothetical protein [Motilibacteraceae bacterium]
MSSETAALAADRLAVVPAARTEPAGGGSRNGWASWVPLCEAVAANLATIPAWDDVRAR